MIGGFVTKGGPLEGIALSSEDQQALARLALKPTFVGIERGSISDAIEGRLPEQLQDVEGHGDTPVRVTRRIGEDGAGSWVVRLGSDEVYVRRVRSMT